MSEEPELNKFMEALNWDEFNEVLDRWIEICIEDEKILKDKKLNQ